MLRDKLLLLGYDANDDLPVFAELTQNYVPVFILKPDSDSVAVSTTLAYLNPTIQFLMVHEPPYSVQNPEEVDVILFSEALKGEHLKNGTYHPGDFKRALQFVRERFQKNSVLLMVFRRSCDDAVLDLLPPKPKVYLIQEASDPITVIYYDRDTNEKRRLIMKP